MKATIFCSQNCPIYTCRRSNYLVQITKELTVGLVVIGDDVGLAVSVMHRPSSKETLIQARNLMFDSWRKTIIMTKIDNCNFKFLKCSMSSGTYDHNHDKNQKCGCVKEACII